MSALLVEKFLQDFKHPVLEPPLTMAKRLLLLNIVMEELIELAIALKVAPEFLGALSDRLLNTKIHSLTAKQAKNTDGSIENQIEILDAICDIVVTTHNTTAAKGLTSVFQPAIEEVMRSNMTKRCKTIAEAEATVQFYKQRDGWEIEVDPSGIAKRKDGKILKSVNYSKPNLNQFINGDSI